MCYKLYTYRIPIQVTASSIVEIMMLILGTPTCIMLHSWRIFNYFVTYIEEIMNNAVYNMKSTHFVYYNNYYCVA